jgi:hypothetical protein
VDIKYNRDAFADFFESEVNGMAEVQTMDGSTVIRLLAEDGSKVTYQWDSEDAQPVIENGQVVRAGDQIATGSFVNPIFYKHLARIILLVLFALIAGMVFVAYRRRIALNK